MRVLVVLLLLSLLSAPAAAAPRGCFTKAEAAAIQAVRHGIRLREGAGQCQQEGFSRDSVALWQKIDGAIGSQFKQQTDIYRAAFQREFEKWATWEMSVWDGRIVHHFRYRPYSTELCAGLAGMLKEIDQRGWKAFTTQAALLRNEVRIDYQICPK